MIVLGTTLSFHLSRIVKNIKSLLIPPNISLYEEHYWSNTLWLFALWMYVNFVFQTKNFF